MRKTLAIAAAVAFTLTAGCGVSATSTPTASYSESVAPSESVPTAVVDFRKDITGVSGKLAPDFADGTTADITFTITNHGPVPAIYQVVFAVYDKAGAQVGAILVNTDASDFGPTAPGGVLKVFGPYGMDGNGKLPVPFTLGVQSVDRIPVDANGN